MYWQLSFSLPSVDPVNLKPHNLIADIFLSWRLVPLKLNKMESVTCFLLSQHVKVIELPAIGN